MSFLTRWWTRATAALIGMVAALLVPATAWAADNEVVLEAVRRRPRSGFGVLAGLCCLVVLALIVVGLLTFTRNRRDRDR